MDNEKNWYTKYPSIHVSKDNWYPCIQVSMYPCIHNIQVSKKNQYPRYPSIRISEKSGIHSSLNIPGKCMTFFKQVKACFKKSLHQGRLLHHSVKKNQTCSKDIASLLSKQFQTWSKHDAICHAKARLFSKNKLKLV